VKEKEKEREKKVIGTTEKLKSWKSETNTRRKRGKGAAQSRGDKMTKETMPPNQTLALNPSSKLHTQHFGIFA
jgi:hypothetical protein